MFIIEAEEVEKKLTMEVCIGLMREAFSDYEKGKIIQPLRSIHQFPGQHKFGFMPAYLGDGKTFGAKVINACHANLGTEYPSHAGYVMMFEAKHGMPLGLVEAGTITRIRTGAVSGVATDLLAKKDASTLAIIGSGAQGHSHLDAMMLVRPSIKEVRLFDLYPAAAEKLKSYAESKYGIKAVVGADVQSSVKDADIICTVTPSSQPYLKAEWVSQGAHINAVGAFTPSTREITSELMAKVKLYADDPTAMTKECGEYLVPLEEGLIDESHIKGTVGGLINGTCEGRTNDDEITLFDALGLAIEDVICGQYFCQ